MRTELRENLVWTRVGVDPKDLKDRVGSVRGQSYARVYFGLGSELILGVLRSDLRGLKVANSCMGRI